MYQKYLFQNQYISSVFYKPLNFFTYKDLHKKNTVL